MKWLNQISIKVKVMLPICILGIVILLASISSLVNSKRLLQAGVVISQDCSKSIELLMDMSSELESMGKNMYGHCDAENSISKESFATTIHEKLESMDSYFKQYKKQKKTAREKEYFGALQNRFKKYKEGMEQVAYRKFKRRCGWCNGGNQCDTETFGRLSCKENQQSDCYAETGNESFITSTAGRI